MLCGVGDSKYQCFHCNKKFAEQEFEEAKRERTVVVCANCAREVTLLPSTFGIAGLGFICSDCSNYVAVLYGTHFINPSTVLTVDWNPTVYRRGESMPSGLSFVVCKTMKDFLVLKVLQAIVKEEDSRFLFGRPNEQEAGLLLDSERRKYLGFLVWTEADYAVLRQIFIIEDERRKGFAEQMVTFWVGHHADRLNESFGIEAPNEKALSLHLKLGHIKAQGDSYVGVSASECRASNRRASNLLSGSRLRFQLPRRVYTSMQIFPDLDR